MLIFRQKEALTAIYFGIGIDTCNTFGHDYHLRLADSIKGSDNLTIEIGEGNGIVINEVKAADAAAGEGFNCITAYAADAENSDMGVLQTCNCFTAKEQLCT